MELATKWRAARIAHHTLSVAQREQPCDRDVVAHDSRAAVRHVKRLAAGRSSEIDDVVSLFRGDARNQRASFIHRPELRTIQLRARAAQFVNPIDDRRRRCVGRRFVSQRENIGIRQFLIRIRDRLGALCAEVPRPAIDEPLRMRRARRDIMRLRRFFADAPEDGVGESAGAFRREAHRFGDGGIFRDVHE